MKPQTTAEMLNGQPVREFIMLAGKDGVGKTSAIVSLAWYVEQMNPKSRFNVIDTENKFKSAMRSFGKDVPKNILYYKCDDMNQVTTVTAEILEKHKPGDWLAVESMSRVWERAQDLGYQEITGTGKAEYMIKRREKSGSKPPVTPNPDHLWNIVKGAHDGAFFDLLSASETLNVVLTTTVAKPPKPDAFIKENADRKAIRYELGIDCGLEGAPRLPYYLETLMMLELVQGKVSCRILRDNNTTLEDGRVEFPVENKKCWAVNFFDKCRG